MAPESRAAGGGERGEGAGACGAGALLPCGSDPLFLRRVRRGPGYCPSGWGAGTGEHLEGGSGSLSGWQRTGKDTERPEAGPGETRRTGGAGPLSLKEPLSLLPWPDGSVSVPPASNSQPCSSLLPAGPPGPVASRRSGPRVGGSANSALCLAPGTSPAGVSGALRPCPACSLGRGLPWMLGSHLARQGGAKPTGRCGFSSF